MCIFHDVKPACHQHSKQLGQGYIGYTMFCVGYELYTLELRSLEYIPLPKQNIE